MNNGCHRKRRKGRKSHLHPVLKEEKDVATAKPLNTSIEVGTEFDSFDCLDLAIKAYEADNFVNLIMRDTRTIEVAEKRNRRKNYNPAIRYSDLCYCCTYGGKKFKSRSVGKRIHKTIKQACPFNLKVRATLDGQRLFIREMCASHNHDINEADFRLHPKQRKLDQVSQEEIATLLCLEPDKKLLREKLMQVTGKVILMKDIHNIKTRLLNSTKTKDQIRREIDNFAATSQEEGKHNQNPQMTVVSSLVDNLTNESGHASHDLSGGKHELTSNSLSIHIPVSQISPGELTSVLNTIVNTTSDSGMESQPENQPQPTHPVDVTSGSEFAHPSNIFPCSLDSFPHQSHEVYQVSTQPLLSDVTSIVAPSPSPVNLNELAGTDARHQPYNPLEDVTTIGINMLHTLQPWQDLDSHNSERTNFQTASTSLPHSHEKAHTIPLHTSNRTDSDNVSKTVSPSTHLVCSNAKPLTANNPHHPPHFQCYQQLQQQQKNVRERKKLKAQSSSTSRKTRRNPIDSDKEALKKKYFQQASVNLFFNERFSFNGKKQTRDSMSTSGAKEMSGSHTGNYHNMLKPLSWLFGTWKGEHGKGVYPTVDDFAYAETAEFYPTPLKPVVEYKLYSSLPDGSVPLHRETGYIKIKPGSNHIAFVAAHNLGIAEVQEGEVKDGELTVETTELARVSFNKPPVVKKVRRSLKRTGNHLEQVLLMETENIPMTEHLRISFKKVGS